MAGFEITAPFAAIKARIEAAKSEVRTDKAEIVKAIGVQVLSLNQKDYRTLSRGGVGSDGRKWKLLDPKTIARKSRRGRKAGSKKRTFVGNLLPSGKVSAIGIDTGLQFASGNPGFTSAEGGNILVQRIDSITVGYGRRYSKYFDLVRKLMPDILPASWRAAIDKTVAAWMAKIIAGISK
jgi:hypothetical protein